MNKFLLTTCIFLVGVMAYGQNFMLDSDSLYLETNDLDEFEYVVYGHIESMVNEDQEFYWEKNIVDCPDNWQVSMCMEICYMPWIHSAAESLEARQRDEYKLSLGNTQGQSGICTWETKFVRIGFQDTTYVTSVWVLGANSSDEFEQVSFSFYPNPVQDVLNLNVEMPVELVISNAMGQTVMIEDLAAGSSDLDLSGLNTGTYTVSVNYKGKNILARQFVKK